MSNIIEANKAVSDKIQDSLLEIEKSKGIHILLAVESGSRAWGFPSTDSDYDVRIIYSKPQLQYLTVFDAKDTIELPITDELDVAGWDISKALKLMYVGNAVIHEWLNSPVVYRKDAERLNQLNQLARSAFNPVKAFYHYLAMSTRKFDIENQRALSAKKFLYGFRTMLCARYVSIYRTAPPMLISELMSELLECKPEIKASVDAIIAAKNSQKEHDEVQINNELSMYITETIQELENQSISTYKPLDKEVYDSVFRDLII